MYRLTETPLASATSTVIRDRMRTQGVTRAQLSEQSGIKLKTLCRSLRDERELKTSELEAIAAALGFGTASVLTRAAEALLERAA